MIEKPRADLIMVQESDENPSRIGCFWCGEPVGQEHASSCGQRRKQVWVRWVVEYPVLVPEEWDEKMVRFHRNDSSWCTGNALDEIAAFDERPDDVDSYDTCAFSYFQIVHPDDPIPVDSDGRPLLNRDAVLSMDVYEGHES